MNVGPTEPLRILKMREIVSHAAGSETARAVGHVAPGTVSGQAIERARSSSDHESVPANVQRQSRRRSVRHVTHRVKVQRPAIEYIAGGGVGESRIDEVVGPGSIEISGK